jgi:hypothetical protein
MSKLILAFRSFAKASKKSRMFFDKICVPNSSLEVCQINVSPAPNIYSFFFRYELLHEIKHLQRRSVCLPTGNFHLKFRINWPTD